MSASRAVVMTEAVRATPPLEPQRAATAAEMSDYYS